MGSTLVSDIFRLTKTDNQFANSKNGVYVVEDKNTSNLAGRCDDN